MKRSRSKSISRLTPDAEKLVALALGLTASGSLTEDRFWETQLGKLVAHLLESGHENSINVALDHLFQAQSNAYETLIDQVESLTESAALEHGGKAWDVLMVAAPIVAWSKYRIASGPLNADLALTLAAHLQAHVMAAGSRVALAPYLYSIDQLPRHFSEVRKLTIKLGEAALHGVAPKLDLQRLPETAQLLSDARFLLAAVVAPQGEALFRWQEVGTAQHAGRTHCLEQWIAQGRPNLAPMLQGCVYEFLLPEAFYVSCRESDRSVRPYSVRAAAAFLEDALKVNANQLCAIIAGFGADRIDEYRISLALRGKDDVAHGIVWPLYGREDESTAPTPIEDIRTQLRECGITEIQELKGIRSPEFCEDCGVPLFPTADGEIVHAGLPEETDAPTAHFH
jgi:Protein of unknown function (DUF2863)